MKDSVDPPTGQALLAELPSEACAQDQGDSADGQLGAGSVSRDDVATSEVRAEPQDLLQMLQAVVGRTKKRRVARNLPEVSEARVQELAREYEGRDIGQNAVVMKYERESPPLLPEARAVLNQLQRIDAPNKPGIYYLWHEGRVVFVGGSKDGVLGPTVFANTCAGRRYGSLVKEFTSVSFQPCPEGLLDSAVTAIARWLRPKYNRGTKQPLRPEDEDVLQFLGLMARAA